MNRLSEKQWKVIKALARNDQTPTELARKLNISLQAADFDLKKLEKMNLIKKTKLKKGKTRPFTVYSIGEGFVYFMEAVPGIATRRFIPVDENLKIHLNIWSIPQTEFHYYIEKFWWLLEDSLDIIKAVAVFGSVARGDAKKDSDIDIMILSSKPKIIDKKFGTIVVGRRRRQKIAIIQVFEEGEFQNMLKKKSKLALEIIQTMRIIYDPGGILSKWK